MQTDYLRYLIKIAECGSMNKAANELFLSQAALTKAMKKLEIDLNCKLLERSKYGVKLTEKGQRVYEDARKICKIEDAWSELSDSKQFTGTVRVGVHNVICSNKFLFLCRDKYPDINILLKEYRASDLLRQFEKKNVDIGINSYIGNKVMSIYDMAEKNDLEIEELYHDKFYIFMNQKNQYAQKDYLEKTDLQELKFVVYENEKDTMINAFWGNYFKKENVFFLNSQNGMNTAIVENIDTVMINTGLYALQNEHYFRNNIVYKELVDMPLQATYYMIYPNAKTISLIEKIVVDILRESLQDFFSKVQ